MRLQFLAACAVLAGLAACSPKPADTASAPTPIYSVQEVMKAVVAPSSAAVWKSPEWMNNPDGPQPDAKTKEADWQALRAGGVALAESTNLLVMEGRLTVQPGVKLEGEGQQGNLTAVEMDAKIKANRPQFIKHARALQDAARETVVAIDKRSPDALLEAGGKVDEACEACHKAFWYPGAP